ncbi:hypothetical protein DL766_009141 [Monosporascus sp. MC13-8B]|uniref:Uncharacterized protein n=1 Tax=Monosporascus cannonballus TaxID=155416 RepID=A0ABY0HJX2_9PEZI|nr:hypothetical protein DL762_000134 [Monosporascus cannonballus]RYO99307.1 hypothetical protein DL763_001586 [Monosporascus cannonballus]RYP16404.1 hypothetical protein DL766_009141 [Monosporascus sp. MC13-8B]
MTAPDSPSVLVEIETVLEASGIMHVIRAFAVPSESCVGEIDYERLKRMFVQPGHHHVVRVEVYMYDAGAVDLLYRVNPILDYLFPREGIVR